MVRSLSIGNFKAFADIQTLPIKPITLIFGANSSGKSSIIHSLLLTNEVLMQDKLDLDIHYTKLGGESVDLGGFRQFVNRRNSSKNVLIGLEFERDDLSDRLKQIFYSIKKLKIIIEFGFSKEIRSIKDGPIVLNYEILTDEKSFFKMSKKETGLGMDFIETKNEVIKNLLEIIVTLFTTSEKIYDKDEISFIEGLNKVIPELRTDLNKFIPSEILDLKRFKDPRKVPLSPINKENRNEILLNITFNLIPFIINDILLELSDCINKELKEIEYLGPLRSYPERHFNFQKSLDNNWRAGGGYAWDVVVRNKEIRDRVNEWLGSEKLKQKYELRVVELVPDYIIKSLLPNILSNFSYKSILELVLDSYFKEELPEEMFNDIIDEITPQNGDDITDLYDLNGDFELLNDSQTLNQVVSTLFNYENNTNDILQDFLFRRQENLNDLILYDKNTNTQISHRDVGIGISQVLPVLVSAFANTEKLITIEQPEIHLHPALQAELGDVFINSALGENNNSFILETHSEHLILRILRRIRETTNNELKEGMIPVRPEDVQIVFVQPSENGAEIINLEINEDGDFKTKWPDGFFEERAEELF